MSNQKPNYNDAQYNEDFYRNQMDHTNSYLPTKYDYPGQSYQQQAIYQPSPDEVNSKDFLIGALVGGIIGAAAALFLAPKSGRELREDVSTQAVQLKDKTVDLTATAKNQTGQIVDKVKGMRQKSSVPMDDGTVSSEGEEPLDVMETVSNAIDEVEDSSKHEETKTEEALKKAVEETETN